MTSPIPPQHRHPAEHEASAHRLATPAARIFAAMVILLTGSGIATVFWKMPTGTEVHALYDSNVIDQDLAGVPLPDESIAVFSLEERAHIVLPLLEMGPVTDNGSDKYAQVYPTSPAVASLHIEQGQFISPPRHTEPVIPQMIPQGIEPIRQILEEKPILLEPVDRDFPPRPDSVSTSLHTIEKSDELFSLFQDTERDTELILSTLTSELKPLPPFEFSGLSPLYPLQEAEL
ncbi:MAG: hypothetical protein FWG73_04420 [Planctomycetaceae bacterium]|nr:hypothetical protein [Planctomycetaceae bacterium]